MAAAFFGVIYLAIHHYDTRPGISREVNRVALVPVGPNEFVFVADRRYSIKATDNSAFSIRSAGLPGDEYTERIVTSTTEETNGIVAAWRHAGSINFVGVFDAKAASPPRLDWKVDLEESAVVEEIAVSDDGEHVAIALFDSTVVVATNGGNQTTVPEIEGRSADSLVWYKKQDRWHLVIIYESFAVVHYDVTSKTIRIDKECQPGWGIGVLCNSHWLVADDVYFPSARRSLDVLRLVPIEGGPATGHIVLKTGDWNPQAVISHCTNDTAAFMCRCLGERRTSVIIIGTAKTDPGSPVNSNPVHGSWKMYLYRSRLPIIDLAYHQSMGCFVTRTNEGVEIETLPWDETKLEYLCSRRKLQRIEQD